MGYSQKEVEAWFKSRGSEFIGVYKNSVSQIKFKCAKCGAMATYDGFVKIKARNGKCWCHKCNKEFADQHKLERMGLERHQAWAEERGSEIIEYNGSTKPVKFRCVTCSEVATYSNINNLMKDNPNCRCKICNLDYNKTEMRITIEEVQRWFKERGAEFVGGEYINHKHPIQFKCAWCGKIVTYSTFSAPRARNPKICLCKECGRIYNSKSRLKDEEVIRTWFREHGSELIGSYKGMYNPVTFRCSECGAVETHSHLNNLKRENIQCTCKKCSRERANTTHRKDINEVKAWFQEHDSELMSDYRNSGSPIKFRCAKCGAVAEYKRGWNSIKKDNPKCWCKSCQSEAMTGSNHPSWNHNLTQEERDHKRYETPEYRAWVKRVYESAQYKCAITGEGGTLSAHHIFNWAQHRFLGLYPWNGVCLSAALHKEFHDSYGRGHNDWRQWSAFYRAQTGKEAHLLEGPQVLVDLVYPGPIQGNTDKTLQEKKRFYAERGINYVVVFLWEVLSKAPIVDSMLGHRAGSDLVTVGARKLSVERISSGAATAFFEENHKQGGLHGTWNFALTDGSTLFSVMNFAKASDKGYQWELERFASLRGYRVPGGASRLWKAFLEAARPSRVKTYADLRYSPWNFGETVYAKLGFHQVRVSEPNYFYAREDLGMYTRVQFQKHKQALMLELFDPALTEKENMVRNGYQIYYDCGNHVAAWEG